MYGRVFSAIGGALFLALVFSASAVAQHGPLTDHLIGPGAFGSVQFVSKVRVHDAEPDVVADLTVFKNYVYVSKWGASDCTGPETGGQKTPDGGAYVIDISTSPIHARSASSPPRRTRSSARGCRDFR